MKEHSPIGRAEANRRNAQHSTGLNTEPAKERARFHAFRHGLTGQTVVLPWEDQKIYEAACREFFRDLKPEGVLENQLVQTIVDASWRLNRAAVLETNLFALAIESRAGQIDTGDSRADIALAMAAALRDEERTLSNMSMYCQRISRQRERAMEQLRGMQSVRRSSGQLAQGAPLPHAAVHGFDFSNSRAAARHASGLRLVPPAAHVSASPVPAGSDPEAAPAPQPPESPRVS